MKHKTGKQLVSLLLTALLLTSALVMAPVAAFAEEAIAISIAIDVCSPWAEQDVYMAGTAYALGDESTYSGFRGSLTGDKFGPVYDDLAEAYGAAGGYALSGDELTRGQVVAALYGIIVGAPGQTEEAAAAYFVEAGLMGGRSSGSYELDKTCTVEEMLVFAARAYEYLAYREGRDAKGFFWKVEGETNTVYLLGSIHISDGSLYPLSRPIEAAFAETDRLAVEADISTMSEAETILMLTMGMYDPGSGETIKDHVPAEVYEMLAEICEAFDIPEEMYDNMKPWLLNLMLQGLAMAGDDIDGANLGIDMHFLRKAHAQGKEIIELESMVFQYNMFNEFSDELQVLQLTQTLSALVPGDGSEEEEPDEEELAAAENAIREALIMLLEIVKAGDEETLGLILGVDMEYEDPLDIEFNKIFLVDRNAGMAEKIHGFLSDEEDTADYFVVVGAAHMLGKTGVVARLTDLGYKVERIR
ncbi:MAG: TraB/GumN family protein [Clostridiales bacterium]|nr:TraB/GumN family protein [Clostridiales bacterium]